MSFEQLHAYWRMDYIQRENPGLEVKEESAPEASKGVNPFKGLESAEDAQRHIVWRGSYNCALLNKYPYNAGHLLVLPYRVVPELEDLNAQERACHFNTILKAKALLTKAFAPDAFNVGYNLGTAAGGSITAHVHCHIVPRWNGDTNFMPVISNTRVLPEALHSTWQRLHAVAQAMQTEGHR